MRCCGVWPRNGITAELPTAVDIARAVADALERHGLPYAIGGALALGFYAVPRATVDVDVNVQVGPGLVNGPPPRPATAGGALARCTERLPSFLDSRPVRGL